MPPGLTLALLFVAGLVLPTLGVAQQAAEPAPAEVEPAVEATVEEGAALAAQRLGFEFATDAPLSINSSEFEAVRDALGRERVIFEGNVHVQQADMELYCGWLEAVYPKKGGGQPETIRARGSVRIVQAGNAASCHEAIFDNVACTASCLGGDGRASLQRGDDVIEADEILFDLCKGTVRARGGAKVSVRGEPAAE